MGAMPTASVGMAPNVNIPPSSTGCWQGALAVAETNTHEPIQFTARALVQVG